MSERKVFLEGKIAELKAEKESGVSMNRLEEIARELQGYEDELKVAQITEQQANVVDASSLTVPRQYDFAVDFNDIFGTAILNDEIQKILDGQRESLHSYYMGLQEERDNTIREQRKEIDSVNEENKAVIAGKNQSDLERDDFKKRFENAADLIKELEAEVARLKDREMELLKRAEEAPLLYPHKIIDVTPSNLDAGEAIRAQRARELAAKPKVWDLQWVDELKQTEYKGTAEDGTELIIKRLELGRYNVQVGPRPEQAVTEVAAEDVQSSVTQEETFQDIPTAIPPSVPAIPVAMVEGPSSDNGQGQTIEERVAALEKRVVELEKVCNLNEESDAQAVA